LSRIAFHNADRLHFQLSKFKNSMFCPVVLETCFERQPQDVLAQTHRLVAKMRASTAAERGRSREIHLVEDVVLEIDPGSDFDQLHSVPRQPENAALGDVF